jgi:microcystin-dependent protein
MNKTDVILLLVIIIAIVFLYKKQENFTSAESNEAVQNIASVYADTSGTVSFNNAQITGNLSVSGNFNMIPRGSIIAFNATTAPTGWALCDGGTYTASNGDKVTTPDLRGRFIRMSYSMTGANGGDVNGDNLPINISDNNAIPMNVFQRGGPNYGKMQQHKFGEFGGTDWRQSIIDEMPTHTHNVIANQNNSQWTGQNAQAWGLLGSASYPPIAPTSSAGGSYGYGIIPPYYVLTYIMKL